MRCSRRTSLLVALTALLATAESHGLDADFWNMQPYYNPVTTADSSNSTSAGRRVRRQADMLLAIPEGAVIAILPKFGWLLYEGSSHEELDFRIESEFLYRFPRSRPTKVGLERADHNSYHYVEDHWSTPHVLQRKRREVRDSRMVRDKKMIYRGLSRVFRNFGLDGQSCILRTVCEISSSPLVFDGIIGELLNIALIPSHKFGDGTGLEEYREAEKFGRSGGDCQTAYMQCPVSIFKQTTA